MPFAQILSVFTIAESIDDLVNHREVELVVAELNPECDAKCLSSMRNFCKYSLLIFCILALI